MAVPTLTTITPAAIPPASEWMVKMDGSGYNVPAIPVPEDQYPGVRVWIDGRESDRVLNVDANTLYVSAPRYLGEPGDLPKAVDVRIANIDATGAIIPGEDVTFSGVLTYAREEALAPAEQPFWMLAIRELTRELKRQINLPVSFARVPDWQDEVRLEYYDAEIPSIGIRDMAFNDYPYMNEKWGRVEVASGVTPNKEASVYRDKQESEIVLDMILVAETKDELLRWYNLVRLMGQRTTRIYVPESEGATERIPVRFTLDLDAELGFNTREVLASATFRSTLGPVPIEGPEVLDRAWENLTINVDARNVL